MRSVSVLVKHAVASGLKAEIAPGQLLTHYAPDVPAFMVHSVQESPQDVSSLLDHVLCGIGDCVVLDVGGRLASVREVCLSYKDLSPQNVPSQSAEGLFAGVVPFLLFSVVGVFFHLFRSSIKMDWLFLWAALRWSEHVPGAKAVLLPSLEGLEDDLVARSLSAESIDSDG